LKLAGWNTGWKLSCEYFAYGTEVSIARFPSATGFALCRAPFDCWPLWIRGSMVSRGFMGNHVAATRSGRRSNGILPTTRWFRVFSNKMENVFPRNETGVVPCTFRGARMSVRIKDKYSWLPAVPGVARSPSGKQFNGIHDREKFDAKRGEPLSISRLEMRRISMAGHSLANCAGLQLP